jgi:hypothetical protein
MTLNSSMIWVIDPPIQIPYRPGAATSNLKGFPATSVITNSLTEYKHHFIVSFIAPYCCLHLTWPQAKSHQFFAQGLSTCISLSSYHDWHLHMSFYMPADPFTSVYHH